jgi:hypothetical protein
MINPAYLPWICLVMGVLLGMFIMYVLLDDE